MPKKNTYRLGFIAAATFLLAWALYVVGVNAFLASSLARKLANSSPEDAGVSYDSAYSWFPFRVHVKNLQLHVEDYNVQVYVSADWAVCDFSLLGISRKGFYSTRLRGDGVVLRIRQQLMPKDKSPDKIAKLPEIPGFPSPFKRHPNMPVTDAHYDMVTVSMTDIDVTNLKELWVDEYRFDGHIDVRGGFFYKPLRLLRIDQSAITVRQGTLTFGGEVVAKNIDGTIDAKVPTINVENFSRAAVGGFDLGLDLHTEVAGIAFLNYYLRDVPEVRLEEGAGLLTAKVKMRKGLVDKGSEVTLDSARVLVRMPYFSAGGAAHVRWYATEKIAKLNVAMKDIAFTEETTKKEVLKGKEFNLLADSTGLDMSKPLDLDLVLDLPEGDAKDLSFLNDFIPPGASVSIQKGAGVLKGNLEILAKSQHARGALDITTKNVVVKNKSATLTGRLTVNGVLKDLDLKTAVTDFSGSKISLDDLTVNLGAHQDKNFWARLTVDECTLFARAKRTGDALIWQTKLTLTMANLSPIIHIIAANLQVPWVVQAFSNWSNIKAHAKLSVHEKSLAVRELYAESGALHVRGDLDVVEIPGKVTPPKQQPFGAILVELGQLKIGIDLEGQKTSPVLIGAEKWFDAHQHKD